MGLVRVISTWTTFPSSSIVDAVDQSEIDDGEPDLRVGDRLQRLENLFLR